LIRVLAELPQQFGQARGTLPLLFQQALCLFGALAFRFGLLAQPPLAQERGVFLAAFPFGALSTSFNPVAFRVVPP
jgi:hypothetical protein